MTDMHRKALSQFCNWIIKKYVDPKSENDLRKISLLLPRLCADIYISSSDFKKDECKKMADQLYRFSLELKDSIDNWSVAINEDDIKVARNTTIRIQTRLLDALKRFDDICFWKGFPDWIASCMGSVPYKDLVQPVEPLNRFNTLLDEVRQQLLDALLEVPVAVSFIGRTSLLSGIVNQQALNRDPNNASADFRLIIDQLMSRMRKDSADPSLLQLINNAASDVRYTSLADAFKTIRQQLVSASS